MTLQFADGRIAALRLDEPAAAGAERVAGTLVPGFVDLHVHGGGGADFMDGEEWASRRVCAFHARHGTTALAATTLSGSREAVTAAVRAAARVAADPRPGEARVVAVHLEVPYVNPARAGAQDPAALRDADLAEVDGWIAAAGELPLLMTVAPEVSGVMALIAARRGRIVFSLGHSEASDEQAAAALAAGARHFTHLFNAMPALHHRRPGIVGAALAAPDATVELIADGHHVHPLLVAALARLMGERVALVTDAMRACGMPDGAYRLGALDVTVAEGTARLADGTLAGSLLTMAGALRTVVGAGVPLDAAVPLATAVPARVLGLAGRGEIAVGAHADLVELDEDLQVVRSWIGGVPVAAERSADGH